MPEDRRDSGITEGAGLISVEAAARLADAGPNELTEPRDPSLLSRLLRHFAAPVQLLLVVVAVLSATVLGEIPEALAIAAILTLDAVISIREESHANEAMRSLRRMRAPRCVVRRDGVPVEIEARDVVVGDILLVAGGDRVAADARIIEADDAEADESIVTGESLPVPKVAGAGDDAGLLLAGTSLVAGTAEAIVIATGRGSTMGSLAARLEEAEPPTPLQGELSHLSSRLGVAAAGISCGVFLLIYLVRGEGLELAFLSAVALAVAAVPQGLPAVVTVGLALGARRMAKVGAVIRRLSAVEGLGSTTVILTDKTGTLTEGRLRIEGFAAVGVEDPVPLAALP